MSIRQDRKIKEATLRMKSLGIYEQTIKSFQRDGTVSISEPPFGAFYWADGNDLEQVRKFEEKYSAVVYVIVRTFTRMGVLDSYLYVSDYEEEWEDDRDDISHMEPMAYVRNCDFEEYSEFGHIGIKRTFAGGLMRIS